MADILIDSGNSRLKLARREPVGWQRVAALDFDDAHALEQALAALTAPDVERVYVASVSKGWRAERVDYLLSRLRVPVYPVESTAEIGRLRVAYAQPQQLGVDRFLALLAASDDARDCLLLSFGSALTVDALAADGRHLGGLIAPSPELQWQAMRDRFPGLFERYGEASLLADNTADALATGIRHQVLGMLQRVLDGVFGGAEVPVLVGGGAAEVWLPHLPGRPEPAPDLIFLGMLRYIELHG
ncbi:MAG: type III pantothenate kinase [Arenimonas sp.]